MKRFLSEELRQDHGVSDFSCGNLVLDDWLRRLAWRAQAQGTARTVVWVEDARVMAYYSIAPTLVSAEGLNRRTAGGVTSVPGFLLGRLALDRSAQGRGFGTHLLLDALDSICRAAAISSGRVIVVDPINDEAASFYAHHGFEAIKNSPRMVMLASRARESLR
ncbi:MAG: GNAT family N-acetyltransferase [Bifidobacteriaceae bacterium]|jgi:GNAT superfamily N-acetyltransferase|nr:GNAT family N-acetyltransferase [Bifidobacteriaceae bacterium]